jgi:RHS repeat-associated protein
VSPAGFDEATNRISPSNQSSGWAYDTVGRLTRDWANQTYGFDAEGRMVALCPTQSDWTQCGSQSASAQYVYTYDGNGKRVEKLKADGSSTIYVYDGGGNLAAEYGGQASSGTEYLIADPLGSTRMVISGSAGNLGCPTSRQDYLPFGFDIPATVGSLRQSVMDCGASVYGLDAGVTQKFTGKERDAEGASWAAQGLDYFGARYFSGAQGRFTSPDPQLLGSNRAFDPQRWNLYAYARNNPVAYIDPDGREAILFYRPPDHGRGSLDDYGHVFLYVRNDRTGRSGFFDYYQDQGRSAVHRSVAGDRISRHAGLVIKSNPEAEDRMLDKMDALTKQDPVFHANLVEVLERTESDCVSTSEEILKAGGIESSARTPTGLWEDLSGDLSIDMQIGAYGIVATRVTPRTGVLYGSEADKHFAAMERLINDAERQKIDETERLKQNQQSTRHQ